MEAILKSVTVLGNVHFVVVPRSPVMRWLAMDRCGEVFAYEVKPEIKGTFNTWSTHRNRQWFSIKCSSKLKEDLSKIGYELSLFKLDKFMNEDVQVSLVEW